MSAAMGIATPFRMAAADGHGPRLDENAPTALAGLEAPATAGIDALGVPVIEAAGELDAYRVEGFFHAQDRFGAMDLFRRAAAGELAEWVGATALPSDRERRTLGLRAVAERAVARLPARQRLALEAYAAGVNAGLAARTRPPAEHAAFAFSPAPWRPEDSLLVILALAWRLHEDALIETQLAPAFAELPAEAIAFLVGAGGSERPVAGPGGPDGESVAIPSAEVIDLRKQGGARPGPNGSAPAENERIPGSNAFAVSGRKTGHGAAIVAGDMHLSLAIPGIWYRIELAWPGGRLMGFSLPGVPGIVVGSNGSVAWAFTNLHGDFLDHALVEVDPADQGRYRIAGGSEPFAVRTESIAVRGGTPESIEIRSTRWGPIVGNDASGRPLALRWSMAEDDGLDLGLLGMAEARSVEDALDVAAAWRGPPLNVLVADRDGRIGWTISGLLPRRVGFDGSVPHAWTDGQTGWAGSIGPEERPRIVDPPEGFLVSANQRPLPDATVGSLGTLWPSTDRARRIHELLAGGPPDAAPTWSEPALADVQLDTYVARLVRWRDVALRAIDAAPPGDPLGELRPPLAAWDGHADLDAEVVDLLDRFRRGCSRALRESMVAAGYRSLQPLPFPDLTALRLAEAGPLHFLPPPSVDWSEFLRDRLRAAAAEPREGGPLRPWGAANRLAIAHPLAANPLIKMRMSAPSDPQPGHPLAVRVAAPSFGASQRMVVAPGREDSGLLSMPLGQSGDPLDGHFLDHHERWIGGKAFPFCAGPPASTRRFGPPA